MKELQTKNSNIYIVQFSKNYFKNITSGHINKLHVIRRSYNYFYKKK